MKSNLFFLAVLCLMAACKSKESCEPEPSTVSFSNALQPLLSQNCAKAPCHGGAQPAGGLDLSEVNAYQQLTQSGSGYVKPGNANGSLLYIQMNSIANPMPPSGKLTDCQLELVKNWINQGGLDN